MMQAVSEALQHIVHEKKDLRKNKQDLYREQEILRDEHQQLHAEYERYYQSNLHPNQHPV